MKTDCEFVGARVVRNLKGQKNDIVLGAQESSFNVCGTGNCTHGTEHEKGKTGLEGFEPSACGLRFLGNSSKTD